MSTEYYGLREPITSLRLEEGPGHDRLTVWENHANAGTLCVSSGAGFTLASCFANRDVVRAHSYYGGPKRGCIVECDPGLDSTLVVVDDCGRIYTIAQVRAFDGKGSITEEMKE